MVLWVAKLFLHIQFRTEQPTELTEEIGTKFLHQNKMMSLCMHTSLYKSTVNSYIGLDLSSTGDRELQLRSCHFPSS